VSVPAPQTDGAWHRLHPVTPAVKGWKIVAVLLAIYAQNRGDDLVGGAGAPGRAELLVSVGILVVGALVATGWSYLSWRMTRYRVGEDVVELHRGVLNRQQRRAPLDRLQAVDVVQPLLARLLGLSELKLEVAGGAGSDVKLAYLREADAGRLRNTLLARAAGVAYDTDEAPEAPEHEVIAVPTDRLLVSLLRSGTTVAIAVAVVCVLVVVVGFGRSGVLVALAPAALGLVGAHWARFSREFAFRVAVSPDGVRLRHGLLESRAQTVPPGRVQAVRLSQPLFWRSRDWWRVQVNVAGYGGISTDSGQADETVLLPVGTRDEAYGVLSLVLPDFGHADPRSVLDDGLTGSGVHAGFTTVPRRARWLDPLAWRRYGFAVTDRALLTRSGRWHRQLDVVPHEKTQSLGLTQGLLQRRLGLASVVAHSTPGPVSPTVPHLDAGVARSLLADQAGRARRARAGAAPQRWMTQRARQPDGGGVDLRGPLLPG
jgi:putative membrane protein